jgi:protein translocase SecG subunit
MLNALLMIDSALIIILSLLQSGKTDGMSGAFTGNGGLNLFANVKERGSEKIVSNLTLVLGIIFFVLVIAIRIFELNKPDNSGFYFVQYRRGVQSYGRTKKSNLCISSGTPERKKKTGRPADRIDHQLPIGFCGSTAARNWMPWKQEYQVFLSPEGQYETREQAGVVEGRISINRSGMGFLDQEDRDSIKIDLRDQNTALDGDTVLVKCQPWQVYGSVLTVLQRAREHVIGTFVRTERGMQFVPDDTKLQPLLMRVQYAKDFTPIEGMKVLCDIEKYGTPLVVRVVKSIGYKDDPGVDITSILLDHDIVAEFPEEVMEQVRTIPQEVPAADLQGRTDLSKEITVTIDGDDSKDFDDAVSVQKNAKGWLLKVSIADVSHYVTWNSLWISKQGKEAAARM